MGKGIVCVSMMMPDCRVCIKTLRELVRMRERERVSEESSKTYSQPIKESQRESKKGLAGQSGSEGVRE